MNRGCPLIDVVDMSLQAGSRADTKKWQNMRTLRQSCNSMEKMERNSYLGSLARNIAFEHQAKLNVGEVRPLSIMKRDGK